jgi:hypothetical protein
LAICDSDLLLVLRASANGDPINLPSTHHLTSASIMASDEPPNPMAESGVTIRSDSEQYSGPEELTTSPPSSSSPAVILYQPPTIWSIIRGAAINLLLPFINGMMLGFGELFAHEAAFRLGWSNTRVRRSLLVLDWANGLGGPPLTHSQVFPVSRREAHPIGPGIEAVEKPRRRNELDDLTSLE